MPMRVRVCVCVLGVCSPVYGYHHICMRVHVCDAEWRVFVCMAVFVCAYDAPMSMPKWVFISLNMCVHVCACVSTHVPASVWYPMPMHVYE